MMKYSRCYSRSRIFSTSPIVSLERSTAVVTGRRNKCDLQWRWQQPLLKQHFQAQNDADCEGKIRTKTPKNVERRLKYTTSPVRKWSAERAIAGHSVEASAYGFSLCFRVLISATDKRSNDVSIHSISLCWEVPRIHWRQSDGDSPLHGRSQSCLA
jgi:hypothetical protein